MENTTLKEIDSLKIIASTFAKTSLSNKRSEEEIFVTILLALELNLPVMQCLINGIEFKSYEVGFSRRMMHLLVESNFSEKDIDDIGYDDCVELIKERFAI